MTSGYRGAAQHTPGWVARALPSTTTEMPMAQEKGRKECKKPPAAPVRKQKISAWSTFVRFPLAPAATGQVRGGETCCTHSCHLVLCDLQKNGGSPKSLSFLEKPTYSTVKTENRTKEKIETIQRTERQGEGPPPRELLSSRRPSYSWFRIAADLSSLGSVRHVPVVLCKRTTSHGSLLE